MPYCTECGGEVETGVRFCGDCGTEIEVSGSDESLDEANIESVDAPAESTTEESVTRSDIGAYSTGQKLVLGGGVVAIIAAFLPWISVDFLGATFTESGIDGDGIFTLIAGVLLVAITLYIGPTDWDTKSVVAGYLFAGIIALFGILYINDPFFGSESPGAEAEEIVNVGIGLYLTALAGIIGIIGTVMEHRS